MLMNAERHMISLIISVFNFHKIFFWQINSLAVKGQGNFGRGKNRGLGRVTRQKERDRGGETF